MTVKILGDKNSQSFSVFLKSSNRTNTNTIEVECTINEIDNHFIVVVECDADELDGIGFENCYQNTESAFKGIIEDLSFYRKNGYSIYKIKNHLNLKPVSIIDFLSKETQRKILSETLPSSNIEIV